MTGRTYLNQKGIFYVALSLCPQLEEDPNSRRISRFALPVHIILTADTTSTSDAQPVNLPSVGDTYLPGYVSLSPLGLPTTSPSILLPQGHTAPYNFYLPQDDPTLPPTSYIPARGDYVLPPSFELSSSVERQGSLFPSLPGCAISPSVASAQARPYASRVKIFTAQTQTTPMMTQASGRI
ncbi:hypothetical protein BDR07DRAFT_1457940 [Suillus spraguei]|nr:hypothetical protein BDR07DRAFT_1457940 [Suillus spraguei]